MHRVLVAVAAGSAALFIGGASLAADQPARDGPLAGLSACRTIADPAARVACYDKAVDALTAAAARNDVVVMDRQAVKETKRGLFGFNIGKLPLFGGGRDDPADIESTELKTKMQTLRPLPYGKYRFTVDGGASWETTEAAMHFRPRTGDEITLQKGTLGGYFVKIGNGRRVAAKRVN